MLCISLCCRTGPPITVCWSARQQCQLVAISEFTMDIQHVVGKSNHVADCLSHALVSPIYVGIDYYAMTADQSGNLDILALKPAQTGLILEDRPVQDGGPPLVCDISTSRPRPVLPVSWCRRIFDSCMLCHIQGSGPLLNWSAPSFLARPSQNCEGMGPSPDTFVPKTLETYKFVLSGNAHSTPLRLLYDSPFRVLESGRTLEVVGRLCVLIDLNLQMFLGTIK